MSDKAYDPSLVQKKWNAFWLKGHFFTANAESKKEPYCIVLPPPNVTGALHMGHALVDTLQDVLIRLKRMQGFEVLWVPGTDHAGISTQSVVEKHLYEKTGKRRSDFSREEFLEHVWAWKEQYEKRILDQLKELGSSLDWSRLRFTMDEKSTLAVKTAFKKLYDDGYIYRGDYLVNWDPVLQTAIADDEVEHEDREGHLWHFRYPFVDNPKEGLVVATTRPETMLGDTAVAVSPNDERYKHLVGKKLLLPLMNREIPIIADMHVDPTFGTGCVKVTPAHDFNDYEIGQRHSLLMINILNPNGTINENGGAFVGLSVEEARKEVVQKMNALGFLEKVEAHAHRVGVSYRSKAIAEPYLSKQWFMKMAPFKEKLIKAVEEDRVQIIPEPWKKVYFHWIENLRDWCISRQLWWGHRIPIWYHKENPEKAICHIGDDLPKEVAANPDLWVQESDVLDTWFSSALWPLTTLGWPEKTKDLKKFYPTATLITGHDILFFWVARMILMGEHFGGDVPFHKTFIHGLIYGKSYWRTTPSHGISYVSPKERLAFERGEPVPSDVHSKWEKMSKSKGNIIDPIEIIEEYGTDAMRLTLAASVTHARQIDLDRRRFEEYKNFANKIWNASRFIFLHLESENPLSKEALRDGLSPSFFTLEDKWILSRLNQTIQKMTHAFENYHFDEATKLFYTFFWDEFCAYYLELAKPYLFGKAGSPAIREHKQKILLILLTALIRLVHPIAPFITEEIFEKCRLFASSGKDAPDPYTQDTLLALSHETIMNSAYPVAIESDIRPDIEDQFAFINELVHAIRNIRAEMQIPLKTAVSVHLIIDNETTKLFIEAHKGMISSLVRIDKIDFALPASTTSSATAIVRGVKIVIPLPSELQEKEKERLIKEIQKQLQQMESFEKKLSDTSFIERAPPELVAKTKSSLKEAEMKHKELTAQLALIS